MSWWFIRSSPDGRRAAGGHIRIQEDDVDLGPGIGPRYSGNDAIFCGRQPDGAFMRWDRGRGWTVVREQGFNFYDVDSTGRWGGYRADPPRLIWSRGVVWLGWADGDISTTRWAARQHHSSALFAGRGEPPLEAPTVEGGNLIDPRGCSDVRLLGDVLVWSVGDHVYGQRHHGARIEDWSIHGETHFWPVPVLVGGRLYLATHTFDRLLFYEAREGQTHGHVVTQGISDFPDAVALDDRRVRFLWSAQGEKGERVLDITQAAVDLRQQVPPPDPPPRTNMTITDPRADRFPLVAPGGRLRCVCAPDGGEWASSVEWIYRRVGAADWTRQDDARDPRHDSDHTFRFPGPGEWEIGLRWPGGQTGKQRRVRVEVVSGV